MWKKHFRERLLEEEYQQQPNKSSNYERKKEEQRKKREERKKKKKEEGEESSEDSDDEVVSSSSRYNIPRVSSRDLNFPQLNEPEEDVGWSLWNPPEAPDKYEMISFLKLNCLLGTDVEANQGKVWMVPVDSTPSSKRALQYVLEKCSRGDFIWVIHVRFSLEEDLPDEEPEESMDQRYAKWREAVLAVRWCKNEIERQRPSVDFEIFIPVGVDHRKTVVRQARMLGVQEIVVGKHNKGDKQTRVRAYTIRPFHKYVRNHAPRHNGSKVTVV